MRASRWWYAVAGLIGMAAVTLAIGTIVSVVQVGNSYTRNLSRVCMPGSADVQLTSAGKYVIYLETRGVLDGVPFATSGRLPAFNLNLVPQAIAEPPLHLTPSCLIHRRTGLCVDAMGREPPDVARQTRLNARRRYARVARGRRALNGLAGAPSAIASLTESPHCAHVSPW